ncbi:MAG: peptidoglycan DD-metalloendopeptidase family protein [Patescibacteria group bacterium]
MDGVHSPYVQPRSENVYIPTSLKHILVRVALRAFKALGVVIHGLGAFFTYGIGAPLLWFGRGLFRLVLLPAYTQYLKLRQRVKTHPRLVGVRSFGHFLERYAVYAALVTLGVLAVGNNIFARTIRPDEIGRGSIWASLSSSETPDLIVETASNRPAAVNRTTMLAVGGVTPRSDSVPLSSTAANEPESTATALAVGVTLNESGGTNGDRQETVIYVVQSGDTLSTIAHRFGLTSQTLVWANGMSDKDFIKPGQALKIPPVEGYLYTVKNGDTLAGIAQKYKGDQASILDVNRLATAEAIQPGQEIIIPGGEPPAPPAPTPASRRTLLTQVFGGRESNAPPSAPATGARFIWPTTGRRINQYFRGRYHTGIDIEGDYSSPIYAAANGRVVFAAFDRSGYGLYIVISHGNGYETLYGHASKVFVSPGDVVKQGQTIAMIGSTGRSTGPHVHFEIRTGGGFLNPLSFF